MRILLSIAAVLALGSMGPAAAQDFGSGPTIRVEPETPTPAVAPKAAAAGQARASHAVLFALPAPSTGELAQLEAPRKAGVPMQIGFPRPIPALEGDDAMGHALAWETLPDGARVAAISVTSPGAAALRLGLRINAIPAPAILRFHDEDGHELFDVTGASVLATIEANVAADAEGPDARTYWSPVIESSTIVMEIELPAGARASELRLSVPRLSHLVSSVKTDFMLPKSSASCEKDAMCQQSTWGPQMNAVARIAFSSGGYTYLCSGTLLADTDATTNIPYFLTANHCINSQTVASTLTAYWFWRSTACNSGVPGTYTKQQGGATLLYNATATDASFMQLNTPPPAGVTYAGWIAGSPVSMYASVTGLHHPTGDLLKISSGNVMGYLTCTAPSGGQFSCSSLSSSLGATFYDVGWSSGIVEGGSSGSALFDGNKYVVGQLYGGSSSCTYPMAGDSYGRFDVSYQAALSTWLNPPPPPRLTVTRTGSGAGSVSSAPAGIDCGNTCSAPFALGSSVTLTPAPAAGSSFAGWTGAGCTGTGQCTVVMNGAVGVSASFIPTGGAVTMSTTSLAFTGNEATQSISYTNNMAVPVTFARASLSSTRYGQVNTCGTVPPGASCIATVTYYPLNSGSDTGTLTLTSTAPNSPHVANLSATQSTASATSRLTGISTRMRVLTGNDVMIGGFIVGGTTVKTVVVRARGPSLVSQGIANALANPTLQLVRASDRLMIAANDDWGSGLNAGAISASGFAPSNPLESAVLVTLEPGAYTAVVSGVAGGTGVGIVEVFEIDNPAIPLTGISTRGRVLTGNDVAIVGFVIHGDVPQTVIVRARGPSLVQLGVTDALGNPMLQLVRASDAATIGSNDDWGSAANASAIAASGYAPSNALEAAILITLDPGAYTAIVSGAGGGTGVGIVEVFAQ